MVCAGGSPSALYVVCLLWDGKEPGLETKLSRDRRYTLAKVRVRHRQTTMLRSTASQPWRVKCETYMSHELSRTTLSLVETATMWRRCARAAQPIVRSRLHATMYYTLNTNRQQCRCVMLAAQQHKFAAARMSSHRTHVM